MIDPIEGRRSSILAHETAAARTMAALVVEKPTLSVWMILIPLLFVYYMQRHQVFRRAVAQVAEALVQSRRSALDRVCADLRSQNRARPEPVSGNDDECIRSLRCAQEAEIALLARHYSKLLTTHGSDYRALVQQAYGDADAYGRMLEELNAVERLVSAAAYQARRDESSAELLQRLEHARLLARARELKLTFG